MHRRLFFYFFLWTMTLSWGGLSLGDSVPERLDLDSALTLSRQNHRLREAARARVEEARGDLTLAGYLLVNNPELGFSIGPRYPSEPFRDRTTDFEIAIGQRFEIAGQRGHRIDQAESLLLASESEAQNIDRVIDVAVATVFYQTLAAMERLSLREEAEQLALGLYDVAERRLERGDGTPLALNTARIRLAEARRRTLVTRADLQQGLLSFSEVLGMPPEDPLILDGELPTAETAPNEDEIVEMALRTRPDLAARTHAVDAAAALVELTRSQAWPDLSVGFSYERDELDDKYQGRLIVPLPFFNRNQGPIASAQGTLRRVGAEAEALGLAIDSEVRRAYSAFDQARRAAELYNADVVAAQAESLDLLLLAFQAGEVGYADVILVQRELLDGREGYLDARLALALTQAELLAASNLEQTSELPSPVR